MDEQPAASPELIPEPDPSGITMFAFGAKVRVGPTPLTLQEFVVLSPERFLEPYARIGFEALQMYFTQGAGRKKLEGM